MNVQADTDVVEFVRDRGGQLFVWTDVTRCCSGATVFLDAATERPASRHEFQQVPGEPFDLYVDFHGRGLPDALELDLRGLRHKRVRAYWNGCAWVLD